MKEEVLIIEGYLPNKGQVKKKNQQGIMFTEEKML